MGCNEGKRQNEFAKWHVAWLVQWRNYAECDICKMTLRNKFNSKAVPFLVPIWRSSQCQVQLFLTRLSTRRVGDHKSTKEIFSSNGKLSTFLSPYPSTAEFQCSSIYAPIRTCNHNPRELTFDANHCPSTADGTGLENEWDGILSHPPSLAKHLQLSIHIQSNLHWEALF